MDNHFYHPTLKLHEFKWNDGHFGSTPYKPVKYPDPFHIGQIYEKIPAKQIQCERCNGTNFHVGCGSYFTAIRCIICKWEYCIHDG